MRLSRHPSIFFVGFAALVACSDDNPTGDTQTTPEVDASEVVDTSEEVDTADGTDTPEDGADGQDSGPAEDTALPPACENPPATLSFETLNGFTDSEDFAFDDQGRLVMNEAENLVRLTRDGDKRLFVPNFGTTAGMRFLPGGDLIISELTTGTLKRVAPNGGHTVVLAGLEYANGVEVDSRGYIYLAEQNAGRVRRVDPETGEFIVVGYGMSNPNGVSLSVDEKTLFVGSFGAGVVYAIDLEDEDHRGATRVHGRIPTVSPDSGAVVDLCGDKAAGDLCTTSLGSPGTCQMFGGILDCVRPAPCDGLSAGHPCLGGVFQWGTCAENSAGGLDCRPNGSCDGLLENSACVAFDGSAGRCVTSPGEGTVECVSRACDGVSAGGTCQLDDGRNGVCQFLEFEGGVSCQYADPCGNTAGAGDVCTMIDGTEGTCLREGDFTSCAVQADTCIANDLDVGRSCRDRSGVRGQCEVSFDGVGVICVAPEGCEGRAAGDTCLDLARRGECIGSEGGLRCHVDDMCSRASAGAVCTTASGLPGLCGGPETHRSCQAVGCETLPVGAACDIGGVFGFCSPVSAGGVRCEPTNSCLGLSEGDYCSTDTGLTGTCMREGEELSCSIAESCAGMGDGVLCIYGEFYSGVCAGGVCVDPYQALFDACLGLADGEACRAEYLGTQVIGTCMSSFPGEPALCQPSDDPLLACTGLVEGDSCQGATFVGVCVDVAGELTCQGGAIEGQGGLDGITVDGCGMVYATEYVAGLLWRFPREGGEGVDVLTLPSTWIPNLHFGTDRGGWRSDRLYIGDRDAGRLFEVDTGTPPSPVAWPPALQGPASP